MYGAAGGASRSRGGSSSGGGSWQEPIINCATIYDDINKE